MDVLSVNCQVCRLQSPRIYESFDFDVKHSCEMKPEKSPSTKKKKIFP